MILVVEKATGYIHSRGACPTSVGKEIRRIGYASPPPPRGARFPSRTLRRDLHPSYVQALSCQTLTIIRVPHPSQVQMRSLFPLALPISRRRLGRTRTQQLLAILQTPPRRSKGSKSSPSTLKRQGPTTLHCSTLSRCWTNTHRIFSSS